MNKLNSVILIVCVALITAGYFWLKPTRLISEPNAPQPPDRSIAPKSQSQPAPGDADETRNQVSAVASLSRELIEARDLRVFTEMAKQRPQDGGIYFAKSINNFCWGAREFLMHPESRVNKENETHKTALQRDAATDKLRRLCGGFLAAEADVTGLAELVNHPAAKLDPLLNAERASINASLAVNRSQQKLAVEKLLENPAPLAIVNAPLSQMDSNGGLIFDGKIYGGKADPKSGMTFQAARFLAACKFGDDCGASDRMLLLPCAMEGICVNDRFEYVSALLAKEYGSQNHYQEVVQLSEKIAFAIEQKNVDAFFKPSTSN